MLEIFLKTFCKKSFSMIKGLKGGPFEHNKTFFRKMYFFKNHKNAFDTNSRFLSHKYARNRKDRILDRKVFKLHCFSKVFFSRMLVKTPYFGGVINPKTS